MKLSIPLIFAVALSLTVFAQEQQVVKSKLDAHFEPVTNSISYARTGEITKDGILLINLKSEALDRLEKNSLQSIPVLHAIERERASLEMLRHRILIQRERLMKPLPPMQETQ